MDVNSLVDGGNQHDLYGRIHSKLEIACLGLALALDWSLFWKTDICGSKKKRRIINFSHQQTKLALNLHYVARCCSGSSQMN